jgi:SAM-dependent methyltransferase
MRALDWGCGNGHFSYFLTRQHIATTGFTFDNFPVFLESEPLFCFVKGSISEPMKLPIPDSSFDVVFSVGVLEHVHETGGSEMESLREIRRILKHGGRFVCFHFPNKYQWVETLGKPLGLLEHFHQRKYTRKYIERLTEQSGFRIVEIGRYNFFPRNQLRFLPDMLTKQDIVVYLFESLEWLASHLLSCFCTNYYFVAENKQ